MNREAKIGLFVLISLGIMIYFILRTSDLEKLLSSGGGGDRQMGVTLEDASGIREGTAVRIAGVKVGEVQEIILQDGIAVAMVSVPADLSLKDGARAELRDQGVLGERYISLVPGSGALLSDQSRLTGTAPPSLGDLTQTIDELANNMVAITDVIKQGMKTPAGNNRVEIIAANIERLTETLVQMLEENRGNLGRTSQQFADLSAGLNRDIPALIAEMTELVKDLRSISGENRPEIDQTMSNMAALSANMDKASASLSSIADKVDKGQGTLGKLVNEGDSVEKLNTLLDNANESLGQVKSFLNKAEDIKLNLVFRSEYLERHQANKNYFGVLIRPNDQKYYLVEGISRDTDYLPSTQNRITQQTFDANGDLLTTTVRSEVEEPDEFVFNGHLAYRFGNMYLKAGVFESEGGAGLEYYAMEDRLRFGIEGFDFGRDDMNPHGKLDLRLRFTKHLTLNAGWDDFLESDLNSVFIGGGVRWTDDDLKILLTNVGKFF